MEQEARLLTPIGDLIEQNVMPSMPLHLMRPTSSTGNVPNVSSAKLRLPPLITPRRMPENIIRSIFSNPDDYDDMVRHLSTWQKNQSDWNQYRQKIPDELLQKWSQVMKEFRLNGYLSPRVENGKIVPRQILTHERTRSCTDQCTLCPNTIIGGMCKGQFTIRNNQKFFIPCH